MIQLLFLENDTIIIPKGNDFNHCLFGNDSIIILLEMIQYYYFQRMMLSSFLKK